MPEIPSNIPPSLKESILKCWKPNPKDRPSFKDLFNTIHQQIVDQLPTKAELATKSPSSSTETEDYQNVSSESNPSISSLNLIQPYDTIKEVAKNTPTSSYSSFPKTQ
jgi:hypothetical protein